MRYSEMSASLDRRLNDDDIARLIVEEGFAVGRGIHTGWNQTVASTVTGRFTSIRSVAVSNWCRGRLRSRRRQQSFRAVAR
jgi:hypothetical protein